MISLDGLDMRKVRLFTQEEMDKKIQDLRCQIIEHKLHPNENQAKKVKAIVEDILKETW